MMVVYKMRSPARADVLPSHDALVRLADSDPEAFEALRRQLIEDFINRAPDSARLRLRGIQYRVEAIRSASRSPLGATVKIHELMWKSFLQMNQRLQELVTQPAVLPLPVMEALPVRRPEKHSATIIGFPLRPGGEAARAGFSKTLCLAE